MVFHLKLLNTNLASLTLCKKNFFFLTIFFRKKYAIEPTRKKCLRLQEGWKKNPENVANFFFLCILSGPTCRLDYTIINYNINYTFIIKSINESLKRFVKRN